MQYDERKAMVLEAVQAAPTMGRAVSHELASLLVTIDNVVREELVGSADFRRTVNRAAALALDERIAESRIHQVTT